MPTRIDLPLITKIQLIKDFEWCLSQKDLAAKYKISTGGVCNILKRKEEYLGDYKSNQCNEVLGNKIDGGIYAWFVAQRAKNLSISGLILQEKARQIATDLDDKVVFKVSNGCLEKFKIRHNISFREICGGSGAVNSITTSE
ncbi:unnamed protein product [Rotaria sordida]|uniref:HTH CENPB-type domain-containing protein n=1 Tax=Rotaria sordida TaxID=392033 RepID=A0A819P2D9_9BILA|nr:unnamed protein product [Rotaria sordida]CAF1294503.1 unnamed protein product [Rotaria sordida]CAF1328069.1 unnamed protein product [Rotaria sordida]CAF1540883.1 unnamed protein product [Rotaria sordida]CAF3981292.1 unnamed protein product [Rotaria sordida]